MSFLATKTTKKTKMTDFTHDIVDSKALTARKARTCPTNAERASQHTAALSGST
jgi:hypothetical protein